MVADNPDLKIELKAFFAQFINDHETLFDERAEYKDLPTLSEVTPKVVWGSYLQVVKDVAMKVQTEIERLLDTPELMGLSSG